MAKSKNTPKLRFPEFSEEWKEKKFGDLFEFFSTNSFSRSNLNVENGEVQNIHYGDIHKKFPKLLDFNKFDVPFINEDIKLEKFKEDSYCKDGDLIIADASEDYEDIGKAIELINIGNKRVLAGLHTFLARDKSGLTKEKYRGYILLNNDVKLQIKKIATGISVLGISKTNLENIKISIPSLEEQDKISKFLNTIAKKISLLEDKLNFFKDFKKFCMQQLFARKLRFTKENGENYLDWREEFLGNMCSITTGKLDANNMVKEGKYKFFTCAKEVFNIDDYAFDTEALLISGNGAHVGYIHYYNGKFNAYQRTYVLNNFRENIIFIKFYLDNFLKKRIMMEKNEGSTPYIKLNTLSKMKIYLPNLKEQEKIAKFLTDIDKKIENINYQLDQTKEFKKGLLQQMFI